MKRIKLINRIFYCIFLLGFLLFMASGFIFSTVDEVTPADKRTSVVVKPEDTRYIGDDTIEYYVKIRAGAGNNNALAFVSRHQEVEVYAGGRLIYYIKAHSSIYGTTTGTNYTIVNLPPYTTDITVRLTNVYAGHKIRGTTFEYGDETKLVKELIAKSLPSAVLSSFIIIVGFAMIILWIFCRKKIAQTQALFYFGIFAMIIGAWALNETDIATILVQDRKIGSLIGYVLLMMIPIPFMQAEKNFFQIGKSAANNILCAIYAATAVILLVCHMTGVCEFKNSVYIIHMMLVMSLVYFCAILIKRVWVKGFDRKVKANIIGAAALGISMIVDLIAYYKGMQQTDLIGKLGILVFIIVLGYESISEAFVKIKEGQKAIITIGSREYEGEVLRINRMAEQNNSGAAVVGAEIKILNPDSDVILGVEAKVVINTEKVENAVLVPITAVNVDMDGEFVYVVEDNILVKKPVTTGISTDTQFDASRNAQSDSE